MLVKGRLYVLLIEIQGGTCWGDKDGGYSDPQVLPA